MWEDDWVDPFEEEWLENRNQGDDWVDPFEEEWLENRNQGDDWVDPYEEELLENQNQSDWIDPVEESLLDSYNENDWTDTVDNRIKRLQTTGETQCLTCKIRPPNPGYKLCQVCYTNTSTCLNCKIRPPNPGYKLCQVCYTNACTNCKRRQPMLGYKLCQECYTNVCTNCKRRQPKLGYKLCQECYTNACISCKIRPPNTGYKLCQVCYANACTNCKTRRPNPGYKWCQQCFEKSNFPELREVDKAKYENIKKQFNEGMAVKNVKGNIISIFAIYHTQRYKKYMEYQKQIQTKRRCKDKKGNEKRWWHGSTLKCMLNTTRTVCKEDTCSICSILKKGFLLSRAGSKTGGMHGGAGRFGAGLYFAPAAGKSNDYTTPNSTGVKCIILCRLVCGKPFITKTNMEHLIEPPNGNDSVFGDVGQDLNYPELVLYNEHAVLPVYVVFYK